MDSGAVRPGAPPPAAGSPALLGFTLLLGCQLGGEVLARALALPLPGPVLGLLALLVLLALGLAQGPVAAASELLLQHLSLLFVPVGVGVVTHLDRVAPHGLALAAVLLLSTWVGLAVTALALQALRRILASART